MPRPLRRVGRPSAGHPVPILGHVGTLRWGYHVAATIREWTISRAKRHATLTGGVESFDRFRTGQRPLYFVTLLQGGVSWQWPVRRLEIDSRGVRATLGPQMAQ